MGWSEDSKTPVLDVQPLHVPESLSHAERVARYGRLKWSLRATVADPLAIRVAPEWEREHLTQIHIGWHGGRKIRVHKLAAPAFSELWKTWMADPELAAQIISFHGSYVPRFKRGTKLSELSEYKLSNHSWGTAFDINATWNGMGKKPAPLGAYGSVEALVPAAYALDVAWGGDFSNPDGMHFEYVG